MRFDNLRAGIQSYALKVTKCETNICYANSIAQIKTLMAIVKRHQDFLEVYGRGGKVWWRVLKALIKQQKAELNDCSTDMCRLTAFGSLKKSIDKRLENLNFGVKTFTENLLICKDEECRIK